MKLDIRFTPDLVAMMRAEVAAGQKAVSITMAEAGADLKSTFENAEVAASQMMEKATLADYLSDGIAALAKHKIKVDSLPAFRARKVRQRKP